MAGGGVLQLVAVGQQDIYLTANPMITFFKSVYRRHTNFAVESIENTFTGTPNFGNKITTTITRNGDLISRMYLQTVLPALTNTAKTVNWTRYVGHCLITDTTLSIGGQQIDKHYSEWLTIWNELTQCAEKEDGYNEMVGNTSDLVTPAVNIASKTLYIPLQFWFNVNAGLALPLIALQYHEVRLDFTLNSAANLYITSDGAAPSSGTPTLGYTSLWVDYIYLDTEERKNFAQSPHEYLIEQVQFTGSESITATTYKQRMSFNHPTKELIWAIRLDTNTSSAANRWTDFTDNGAGVNPYAGNHMLSSSNASNIQLNGNDRFSARDAGYFNLIQPYQHHTRTPATGIYVYSFALKPEEHQPSGTLNFSRIDNATLNLTLSTSSLSYLFTFNRNYNIFRCMSGMGGLAYNS